MMPGYVLFLRLRWQDRKHILHLDARYAMPLRQQFPLMAFEAYTTYVGGISMGLVTSHLSLWTPQVPSKGRHPGRQADSGLFPDAPPPWGWSLSRLFWVGPSDGVER